MANSIEVVVSKQALDGLDELYKNLDKSHKKIIEISKQQIDFAGGTSVKGLADFNAKMKEAVTLNEKLAKENLNLEANLKKVTQAEKQANAERVKELQLQKQREVAVDKYNTQLAKEEQKLATASNMYNKVQAELNKLQFAYQNLAVRQAQGISLSKTEAQQMDYLRNRIQMHDKTLKAVDATMGKYQRNVGNYANSFNPLNNSIAQLGREAPAFANSIQTGFMAISNNLPIFFDAMGQVIAQNKELQAQGKPIKSALSQVFGALFSFQTLLSVGVTLLTVYGKEIVAWASSLMGASEALDELNKNQKEFSNARFQGKKDAQGDIIELKKYLAVYNDTSLSVQDREIAYKKLSQQYAYYIKNVSDATIINGKYSDGVNKLLIDLEKQKALEKETSLQVTNKQKLIDIQKEIEQTKVKLNLAKESVKSAESLSYAERSRADLLNRALDKEAKYKTSLLNLKNQEDLYQKAINKNEVEIIKLTKDRIGLEYQEDKQREKKKKDLKELADLQIDQADFLAREFELRKKVYENAIENNKLIADDEKNTLAERIQAYQLYMSLKEQLIKAQFEEENRVIDAEYKNQIDSVNEAYNEQIKAINKGVIDGGAKRIQAENEKNDALKALEKKYFIDRSISYENFEQQQKELRDKYAKEEEYALIQKFTKLNETNEIQLAKLNALRNRNFTGGTLTQETPLSSFKSYYDEKSKIEEEAKLKSLKSDLAINEAKLQSLTFNNKTESEEYKKLTAEKISLEIQLQDVIDANTDKQIKELERYKIAVESYMQSFVDSFGEQSGFSKMFDILSGKIEGFGKDATVTALAVSEAFQQAFNTISESSQANFEAEYNRLEMQKKNVILFAGEGTEAKEEIERQYEQKRKEIARRQAEEQKKLAIFNATIDTIQGVVGAIARVDLYPYNFVLAGLIAGLGAAQISSISSQQVPAFWKGTDNAPEGLAWTQEKGAEVITDKNDNVKTMGNNKGAQLTYLNKGDKVYKSRQDYINKQLMNAGIQPMRSVVDNFAENNSLTTNDFNAGISKLAKTMQSNKGSNTQVYFNNKRIDTDYFKGQRV